MKKQIQEFGSYAQTLGCKVLYDEPMSRHTTFCIGGPADLFLIVNRTDALQKIVVQALEDKIPIFWLGNGSDLLVADEGIRGIVIRLGSEFRKITLVNETELVCGAGAPLPAACRFAQQHSLTGLEFAWGIPASIGGAAYMNAGAYGHTMSEAVFSCSHITERGQAGTFTGSELKFSYRQSAYTGNKSVITSVRFQLKHGSQTDITAQMDDLLNRRKSKQPLNLPNAGSVFKRPKGHFVGPMIQGCGLKGRRVGGAAVSEKHAGFIVNLGGATCSDVKKLIQIIQETVLHQYGVQLECEIKFVG